MARFLVRGSGDVGSAIALRLRSLGHAVVLHDIPRPAHARRGMAFTDAFFDTPESLLGHAPLAIGLGPGFVAGKNADIVIETAWGEALGQVILRGGARAYSGEPRTLGGHGRDRYVCAPAAGEFRTGLAIGDPVREGEVVAHVGQSAVLAPLDGILRGITRDGARIASGIIEATSALPSGA